MPTDQDDDEGAPPPGVRVTVVDAAGNVPESSSPDPVDFAARHAAAQAAAAARATKRTPAPGAIGQKPSKSPSGLAAELVKKFPAFDPEWPVEIKKLWFEDFRTLLGLTGE